MQGDARFWRMEEVLSVTESELRHMRAALCMVGERAQSWCVGNLHYLWCNFTIMVRDALWLCAWMREDIQVICARMRWRGPWAGAGLGQYEGTCQKCCCSRQRRASFCCAPYMSVAGALSQLAQSATAEVTDSVPDEANEPWMVHFRSIGLQMVTAHHVAFTDAF